VLEGSCHCGAVQWRFDGMPESVTACNCTVCLNFCPNCGCVVSWCGLKVEEDGRRRIAVKLRLTEPGPVAHLPIDHLDGFDSFDDLPRDGRCVSDMWF
jgi:hypothetical protein